MTESQVGTLIAGMLGVAFVVLKLCGVIDWSWWWVTAPFWGPVALLLAVVLVVCVVAVLIAAVKAFTKHYS